MQLVRRHGFGSGLANPRDVGPNRLQADSRCNARGSLWHLRTRRYTASVRLELALAAGSRKALKIDPRHTPGIVRPHATKPATSALGPHSRSRPGYTSFQSRCSVTRRLCIVQSKHSDGPAPATKIAGESCGTRPYISKIRGGGDKNRNGTQRGLPRVCCRFLRTAAERPRAGSHAIEGKTEGPCPTALVRERPVVCPLDRCSGRGM